MNDQQENQRKCGMMEFHNDMAAGNARYPIERRQFERSRTSMRIAPRSAVVRIPVVVHVVYNQTEENISDNQIQSQIDALNRDFRAHNRDVSDVPEPFKHLVTDTLIEFALAVRDPSGMSTSGITRTKTTVNAFTGRISQIDATLKVDGTGKAPWRSDNYLNIWVCNMNKNPLGYAAFPFTPPEKDGVVIDYKCFGTEGTAQAPFDKGRTGTHEVGHWLDLLHIWGDDGGACSGSDNVTDTPNQGGPNSGRPSFPRVTCGNSPHGDLFCNYMDYVDDAAMVMFTKGQKDRMDAALQGARSTILNSPGLTPPEPSPRLNMDARHAIADAGSGENGNQIVKIFDGVTWVDINNS